MRKLKIKGVAALCIELTLPCLKCGAKIENYKTLAFNFFLSTGERYRILICRLACGTQHHFSDCVSML